jgi:hypothetical protein
MRSAINAGLLYFFVIAVVGIFSSKAWAWLTGPIPERSFPPNRHPKPCPSTTARVDEPETCITDTLSATLAIANRTLGLSKIIEIQRWNPTTGVVFRKDGSQSPYKIELNGVKVHYYSRVFTLAVERWLPPEVFGKVLRASLTCDVCRRISFRPDDRTSLTIKHIHMTQAEALHVDNLP